MVLCGISTPFGVLFPCLGKVAHALLTRPPLKQLIASYSLSPLDLHVLGTPPAFVLSQDQTLSFNPLFLNQVSPTKFHSFGITVLFALLLFCIVFKVRTGLALPLFERLAQPALLSYHNFSPASTLFSFVFGLFSRLFRKTNKFAVFSSPLFVAIWRTFPVHHLPFVRQKSRDIRSLSPPRMPDPLIIAKKCGCRGRPSSQSADFQSRPSAPKRAK